MSNAEASFLESRFLALPATRRDGQLTRDMLDRAGIGCAICGTLDELCNELDAGAAGIILAEERVEEIRGGRLTGWLRDQPPWSDLPLLLIALSGADSPVIAEAVESLGNVTVLERPTRIAALISAVTTALRARRQQYRARDYLEDRERAHQVESLLAAVVAGSDDAIISKALDGTVLTWNAGAERLFGYGPQEIIGRPIYVLIPPELHGEETELLRQLSSGGRIEHFETVRVTKDGRRVDVSLTISPVCDSTGRVIAASKVARDISLRKQSEAELLEADRRKDEFLAVLAHELRNPLAPIRNSLHILRLTGRLDETADQVTDIMERQVDHMARLVDDLLEVSRITRGTIALRKEPVDLAAIICSAIETSRPLIEAGGHRLELVLPPDPLTVHADSVRLTQVFANLLNNAAKYTDANGLIRLEAALEGDGVVISVRDNGIGMPPDRLNRIFELFFQAHSERGQGGLGIGLTLARQLVAMHGGSIVARSEGPGRGSEFVVRLPRAPIAVTAPSRPAAQTPPPAIAQRRVLVVDDNVDAAESMGMLLRLLGVDAHVVYNGPDALAAIESFGPNVVLLDIGMPGMDGNEVAKRIRRNPDNENITVIALTGWGQEQDRRRTMAAGFDHHLIKPADVNSLRTLLTSLGGAQGSRRSTH